MKAVGLLAMLVFALVILVVVAVSIGQLTTSPVALWQQLVTASSDATLDKVIWQVRAPRIVAACVIGAALGVAGVVTQTVFRNPLADPAIIGVAGGAAAAAAFFFAFTGELSLPLRLIGLEAAAFIGALTVGLLVIAIGASMRTQMVVTTLLVGVVVNMIAAALVGLAMVFSDALALQGFRFWLLGSLAFVGWHDSIVVAVVVLAVLCLLRPRLLDVYTLGDVQAMALGVPVGRVRIVLLLAAAMLVSTSVAVCGVVTFVSLVVPHIARVLVGAQHRLVIPYAAVIGALTLLMCDTAARLLFASTELPLSVITALFGGPFFLLLLLRMTRGGEYHTIWR